MTTATDVGFVEMRIAKVVGLAADDELFDYVVLEEVAGDRQLASKSASQRPSAWPLASAGSPGPVR
jgi:hypothetical protein